MEMFIVRTGYSQNIAFSSAEDAAKCAEALIRGKSVSEKTMNGKTAYAVDENQPKFELCTASVFSSAQERHDALKDEIVFWINQRRCTVEDRSVMVKALKELAGVPNEHKVYKKNGADLKALDDKCDWYSVTVQNGDEYITQAA